MKNFLSRYWIWLLILFMVVGDVFSYVHLYPFNGPDYVVFIFGSAGIIALILLAIITERKKDHRKPRQ